MNERNSHGSDHRHGAGRRSPSYDWVLERERRARRRRVAGVAVASAFLALIAVLIAFDHYFTAVN